jgi:hypothetical protein
LWIQGRGIGVAIKFSSKDNIRNGCDMSVIAFKTLKALTFVKIIVYSVTNVEYF